MNEELHQVIHRMQRKDILKMLKRTYLWIRSTTSLNHNKMHWLNLLTIFDLPENEDASHEDEQGHALPPPSREPDTTQVDLRHHHSVEPEPPVLRPHV